jgi:hypothetical protein
MKNKNNPSFQKAAVSTRLPYYKHGVNVPCKLVRNFSKKENLPSYILPPTRRRKEEAQAKSRGSQHSRIHPIFRLRKKSEIMIALKRSIFSSIYFFIF